MRESRYGTSGRRFTPIFSIFLDFIVVFNMLFYILNSTLQFLRCLGDSKVNLHKA